MTHLIGKVSLSAAFLVSALLLPWWSTVILGILLLGFYRSYAVVVTGGVLMDLIFGVAQPALFGFAYIYTAMFLVLVLLSMYLNTRILE